MKAESMSQFFPQYLSRQPALFGIDPAEAMAQLNEVMQWQKGTGKKAAGDQTRPREELERKHACPRARRAG
ncbi:hypothetical protein [Chromobacterium amazonense]|uniref:hypothetical protein n=1 Tax=Chromobacterium amazonense TaxID=1382803 RepID=UPI0031F66816